MTTFLQLNMVEDLPSLVSDHEAAWRMVGACSQSDPDLAFKGDQNKEYEGDKYDRDAMKSLCNSCPVQRACRDHALVNDERFGVWGGMTTVERDEFRPEWAKTLGKDGIKEVRRKFGLAFLDAGHREHYESRLGKAREARTLLLQSVVDGWEDHLEVLDLLLGHPYASCTVLARRMGKSRTWFEHRFNEVTEFVGVA